MRKTSKLKRAAVGFGRSIGTGLGHERHQNPGAARFGTAAEGRCPPPGGRARNTIGGRQCRGEVLFLAFSDLWILVVDSDSDACHREEPRRSLRHACRQDSRRTALEAFVALGEEIF